jgi:demethylmenaquinone methyltransferase/2-methoxy-6-polyprenyl-1,4-benzoquinol methylase
MATETPATMPPREAIEQKRRMQGMFDAVAPRYDFLNHLLSAGMDVQFRRRAIRSLDPQAGDVLLDLCAGTGDLGFEALRRQPDLQIVGVDLARNMLVRGLAKADPATYRFVQGDAENVPLPPGSVDRACVGFGVRNASSLDRLFREAIRVIRPGGRLVVLEFCTPPRRVVRSAYHAYFHRVLPVIGGWISGNPAAYRYLPESVARFPEPEELAAILQTAGFGVVSFQRLLGGIAAIHTCDR